MAMRRDFSFVLNLVRREAARKILYLPHAVRQMARPERLITAAELRSVVLNGEVIEDYPEDVRGHSCLMHGCGHNGRHLHVVCSPKDGFLAIITAYIPSPDEWAQDFKTRSTT